MCIGFCKGVGSDVYNCRHFRHNCVRLYAAASRGSALVSLWVFGASQREGALAEFSERDEEDDQYCRGRNERPEHNNIFHRSLTSRRPMHCMESIPDPAHLLDDSQCDHGITQSLCQKPIILTASCK